jgi:hypothetical protein
MFYFRFFIYLQSNKDTLKGEIMIIPVIFIHYEMQDWAKSLVAQVD